MRRRLYLPLLAAFTVVASLLTASTIYLVSNPGGVAANSAAARAMRAAVMRVAPPIDNQAHLYVLDGWGGVHPVGASPALSTTAFWPTRDIAFSLALFADGSGGYVMDGWGKLHPVGTARPVDSDVYWPHWIGARQIVLTPWSTKDDPEGYLLDADGGIHPFGGAHEVTGNALWPSEGIARGMVLAPNSTPFSVMGYTLDGYGGVHPFGGAPPVSGFAYWPGQDIARGIVLIPGRNSGSVQGYTLDYSGGIYPFGGAPAVKASASWPGQDIADSIVAWTGARAGSPGGWVLDRHGDVHAFGSAPILQPSQTWPAWDIARGLAGAGSSGGSTERLILDAEALNDGWGSYYNQRDSRWAANNVGPASYQVWKVGCLVADLAMVYTHFGFGSVTPGTVAAHSGWFNSSGAMFNSALNIPGHSTLINRSPDASWISSHIQKGHPVIIGMNLPDGGTHFVTLTGMNGASDYWVNDPWEQNAMHVAFSGEWTDRGDIYEAIAFI